MSVIDAQNALVRRLQTMPGRPAIAYVGGTTVTELPRMVLEMPSATQGTATLSGQTQGEAFVVARIETETGQFSTEATDIFRDIEARFPVGLVTEGVKIEQAPSAGRQYSEDGVFYMPVTIRGRYEF